MREAHENEYSKWMYPFTGHLASNNKNHNLYSKSRILTTTLSMHMHTHIYTHISRWVLLKSAYAKNLWVCPKKPGRN